MAHGGHLYRERCVICHGENGEDVPVYPWPPAYAVPVMTDAEIAGLLVEGGLTMPSFATSTNDELAAILAWLRAEFGYAEDTAAP